MNREVIIMKKALSLILALVMCLSLCACGGNNDTTVPTEPKTVPTEPPTVKVNLGETVSTDIAEFTLLDSSFTYYATSLSTNYVAPVDEPDYFTASVGHCLVSVTFKITNKDRGGSLSFAGGAGNWKPNWTVSYNGADYSVKGYSLSSNSGNHWIDLVVSMEFRLIAQGNPFRHQTDVGDFRTEAVGRIFAILFDNKVTLVIVVYDLLHSAVDSAAEAAALGCVIFIIGAVHQLQGNTFCNCGIGNMITVQIQQCVGFNY